jgi:hypothetical protein
MTAGTGSWAAAAGAGDSSYGIVVGNGSLPFGLNDYCLDAKIDHGSSAGQLDYSACTVGSPGTDGNVTTLPILRYFTNLSTITIYIAEVALYVVPSSGGIVMLVRDVVEPFPLNPGDSIPISFYIRITS